MKGGKYNTEKSNLLLSFFFQLDHYWVFARKGFS